MGFQRTTKCCNELRLRILRTLRHSFTLQIKQTVVQLYEATVIVLHQLPHSEIEYYRIVATAILKLLCRCLHG